MGLRVYAGLVRNRGLGRMLIPVALLRSSGATADTQLTVWWQLGPKKKRAPRRWLLSTTGPGGSLNLNPKIQTLNSTL